MANSTDPTLQAVETILSSIDSWIGQTCQQLQQYDSLGEANQHSEGSEKRRLAELRDSVEVRLSRSLARLNVALRERARLSRNTDLLVTAAADALGDVDEGLELMERFHQIHGDEALPDGSVPAESFPDTFAWDTYHRVLALRDLVWKYPKHIRHSARQMYGWPMIVSHHLNGASEFQQIAELLELGRDYPLDTRPRAKRGTDTPLLRYIEPLVVRLHVLRDFLIRTEETRGREPFTRRIQYWWWDYPEPEPSPETLEVLMQLPALPPLNKESAAEWSSRSIVPLIMQEDAADPETCKIPVLQEVWRHRSVKSPATFRSRLNSRVTDTLQRYAPEPTSKLRGNGG